MEDNTLKEYINNIDPKAVPILLNREWIVAMSEVTTQRNLNEKQASGFKTQTWFAILGIIEREEYPKALVAEAGLTTEQAKQVAEEVTVKIFLKIDTLLEKLFGNSAGQANTKNPLEKTKLNNTFISKPTTRQIEINEKKPDPYLEPINESDTI